MDFPLPPSASIGSPWPGAAAGRDCTVFPNPPGSQVRPGQRSKRAHAGLVGGSLALLLAAYPASAGQARAADAANAEDAAILRAFGNDVGAHVIRNACGAPVLPAISFVMPSVAVVVEADPTGACSGASPPSTLGVVVREERTWRLSASTPGTSYRERPAAGVMPDIVVQYPPAQTDCPVLSWTGIRYEMSRSCRRAGG